MEDGQIAVAVGGRQVFLGYQAIGQVHIGDLAGERERHPLRIRDIELSRAHEIRRVHPPREFVKRELIREDHGITIHVFQLVSFQLATKGTGIRQGIAPRSERDVHVARRGETEAGIEQILHRLHRYRLRLNGKIEIAVPVSLAVDGNRTRPDLGM